MLSEWLLSCTSRRENCGSGWVGWAALFCSAAWGMEKEQCWVEPLPHHPGTGSSVFDSKFYQMLIKQAEDGSSALGITKYSDNHDFPSLGEAVPKCLDLQGYHAAVAYPLVLQSSMSLLTMSFFNKISTVWVQEKRRCSRFPLFWELLWYTLAQYG